MAANGHATSTLPQRSYAAFTVKGEQKTRIGHYDAEKQELTALAFKSGTPLSNLYEVIEVGEDGVEATDRQLLQTLERYGVKAVDTSDGKFDPNLHQAIAEVPGNGKPAGTIVDVVQSGFMIGDRLLRPAMVTVARKESSPANVDTKV